MKKRNNGSRLQDHIPKDIRLQDIFDYGEIQPANASQRLCHTTLVFKALGKKNLTHILQHWITASLHLYTSGIVCQDYQELLSYISEANITEIKGETFLNFLKIRFGIEVSDFYVKGLDHCSNRRLRPLALLNSYIETDSFNPACRQESPSFACPDGFLESYEGFLEYLMNKGLKPSTLRTNRKTV